MHDLTLYFPECSHSERVAEDIMTDLYPAFVFLLLPLCHLLCYQRPGSLGAVGVLPVCLHACLVACGLASMESQMDHKRLNNVALLLSAKF